MWYCCKLVESIGSQKGRDEKLCQHRCFNLWFHDYHEPLFPHVRHESWAFDIQCESYSRFLRQTTMHLKQLCCCLQIHLLWTIAKHLYVCSLVIVHGFVTLILKDAKKWKASISRRVCRFFLKQSASNLFLL